MCWKKKKKKNFVCSLVSSFRFIFCCLCRDWPLIWCKREPNQNISLYNRTEQSNILSRCVKTLGSRLKTHGGESNKPKHNGRHWLGTIYPSFSWPWLHLLFFQFFFSYWLIHFCVDIIFEIYLCIFPWDNTRDHLFPSYILKF